MKDTNFLTKTPVKKETVKIAAPVTSSGIVAQSKKLAFDPTAFVHLRTVLTELYADATYAVVRELLSNAIDSHVKAGTDKPIEIQIPGYNNDYTLIVQDYGTGMSFKEIDENFASYGGSTKRDDAKAIGRYGLGSKSPIAVAKRFDVVSIKDGEKIEFHMGSDDESDDFSIHYDTITETDEPNGVKIIVKYPKGSIMSDTHLDVLFAGIPNLIVDGAPWEKSLYNDSLYKKVHDIDGNIQMFYSYEEQNKEYGVTKFSRFTPINIVLGKVIYPLDLGKLENVLQYSNGLDKESNERNETYKSLLELFQTLKRTTKFKEFFVTIPISFLKPTPSRESLYYRYEDVSVMMKFIAQAYESLVNILKVELNDKTTHKEAVSFVRQWKPLFERHLPVWRGEEVLLQYAPTEKEKRYGTGLAYRTFVPSKTDGRRKVKISATRSLEPIDSPVDIANIKKDILVVSIPSNEIEGTVYVERVRRRFKVIKDKWDDVIFLPEKYYNNPWWNFSEAYDEEIVTVQDLYKFILKRAKELRQGTNVGETNSPLTYPRLVLPDYSNSSSAFYQLVSVEKNSEHLKKPILYVTKEDKLGAYRAGQYGYNRKDYWEFYDKTFADKYTILVLGPRHKLEIFLKQFPNAKRVDTLMKETLEAKAQKRLKINWSDLGRVLLGGDKYALEKLLNGYEFYRNKELINENLAFNKFLELLKTKNEPNDTVVDLFKNYGGGVVPIENLRPLGEEGRKLVEQFKFFISLCTSHNINTPEERLRIVANIFNQENELN